MSIVSVNVGEVIEGSSKTFFVGIEGLQNTFKFINPCCGSCTVIRSIESNGFYAVFKADKIPPQILSNRWNVSKCINVELKDGGTIKVNFSVSIIRG